MRSNSIPDDIGQPFSRKFQHIESCSLRDLQRILEDGRPKNILRLAPSSLCDIVSIVLCFPSSTSQSKLLYLFMVRNVTISDWRGAYLART